MSKKLEIGDSVSRVSKVQIDGKDIGVAGDYVASKDGKVHIPYGSGIGGPDSVFPNYNFVLKGMYCYAEDSRSHFDDFIPVIMGNNPSTAKLSYSVPIRDVEGRMFTWCSTRTFQTLLDAEVCNVAATKYLINKKTPDLPAESDDGTYVLKATKSGSTITYSWVKEQ